MIKRKIFIVLFYIGVLSIAEAAIVPAPPSFDARAYLVMDYNSGRIVIEENIDERVEPASLTKIMTVYVIANELAAGTIKLDDKVIVSEKAWRMEGSRMFIEVDKEVTVEDLLKGVIIQSGNDASVALAEYASGSEEVFVAVMNQYATKLGLKGTNFTNSTGLPDKDHYTTAEDLAVLAAILIREHPEIYAWHSEKEFTFNGIKQYNRNQLLWRDDSVDGIKTGHTESAGYSLVSSAKRGDMRLLSVVVGTDSMKARTQATRSLLNFVFRFYENHKLYGANEAISSSNVWMGETDSLSLGIKNDLWLTIPRGSYQKLVPTISINTTITAPVTQGDVQGTLKISLENEELASLPLVALHSVEEGRLFDRLKDKIIMFFQ